MEKKSGLSFGELFGYGAGGMFPFTLQQAIITYYYLFFLTDILQMPTALAASLFTLSSVVKIITMIIPGVIMDNIHLPWGKYRSWVIVGNVLCFVTSGLLFIKLNIGYTAYFVLAIIFQFLNNFGYNISWIASRAIISPMSGSSMDATKLATAADLGTRVAELLQGYGMAFAIALFAGSKQQYMNAEWLLSVFLIVMLPLFLGATKKYDAPQPKTSSEAKAQAAEKVSFKEMMQSMSRPAITYYLAITFGCMQVSIFFSLMAYYTTYVLNNPQALATAVTLAGIGGFIGVLLTPYISRKLSNKFIYTWFTIASAVCYMLLLVIKDNATLFLIDRFILAVISTPTSPVMVALANDVADYNEMKGISNARSFVTSMMGTMIRVALLIASAIASFGLAAVGYSGAGDPTPEVLKAILNLMAFGPALSCLGCGISMFFYNVDEKELDQYRKDKAAKLGL